MKKALNTASFTQILMLWHEKYNNRIMPWKGEKNPYKIWLSEIILQQTRVDQGLEYFLRFVKKYPTVKKLAAAPDNEVFKLWEGLGYYSRCKNLLHAARTITTEMNGKFPEHYESILQLKGVGPYTAAAIASFAYNLPFAVVDGNVNRVLARFFGIDTPIDSTKGKAMFNELAHRVLDKERSALYNQAIMDFGATVCKPQLPLCDICLLQKHCKAFLNNLVNELPVKEKKIAKKHRWFYYIVAEYNNKLLLKKRTAKDIWQNLHEFVLIETSSHQQPGDIYASATFKMLAGENYTILNILEGFKQQLTHQTIHASFIHIKINEKNIPEGMEMVTKVEISNLAFPRIINDYLEKRIEDKLPVG